MSLSNEVSNHRAVDMLSKIIHELPACRLRIVLALDARRVLNSIVGSGPEVFTFTAVEHKQRDSNTKNPI